MTDDFVTTDVSQDDKLWALLSYLLTPIVPLIVMFAMPDKKDRPFLKFHYMQALIWGVFAYILLGVSVVIPFLSCILGPLLTVATIYFAVKSFQGEYVTIPVITDFAKNQGWI
jgi:uncharacterized protein